MTTGRINGSLPLDITPFVGRETLLNDASDLLAESGLVTLTGPGGVGKTRLALRILKKQAADNAWMINMESLVEQSDNSTERIYARLALELGVKNNGSVRLDTIVDHLRGTDVVLVLDNCESLIEQTRAFVQALLAVAPHVRVLATSREPLAVEGERIVRVGPLALPDAVALFIEHAVAAGADRSSLETSPQVETVCAALDGLPLAIGLAAARMSALSVHELAEILQDRFRVLPGIETVMAWSYDHCSGDEQSIWGIGSVFAGPFEFTAVTAIAAELGMDVVRVTDAITGLVQKSVVTADRSSATTRYDMLDTVREYGSRELERTGGTRRLRSLHRGYHRRLMAQAAATWYGPDELEVMAGVYRQLTEIFAAVDRSISDGDLDSARAICRDLARTRVPFFYGFLGLERQYLRRVIDASLALDAGLADHVDIAATMAMAGWIAVTVGRIDDAEKEIASAKDLLRRNGFPPIAPILFADGGAKGLGRGVREGIGLLSTARDFFQSADTAGDRHMATMVRAMTYIIAGEPDLALDASGQYLREALGSGSSRSLSWAYWTCAFAALRTNDLAEAMRYIKLCLQELEMDDHWGLTWAEELIAWIIAARADGAAEPRNDARRAAWLLGAAQTRQEALDVLLAGLIPFAQGRAHAQEQILALIDEKSFAKEVEAGRRDYQHAVLKALDQPIPRGPRTIAPGELSEREREIAELVSSGLKTTTIGERLHLSTATVHTHIKRIYAKLDVHNRTALAAWVASQPDASQRVS
jgi:predicted ATPase/DNA-binding NarL/FixJ family response regulator